MTRIASYPDLQASLLPLSPLFGAAAALEMGFLVAMVAVLVACRAGLVTCAVAMASAVSADCRAGPGAGSLGPWVPGSLGPWVTVWLVCVR